MGTVIGIDRHLGFHRQTVPLPIPASWHRVSAALGLGPSGTPLKFEFRRRRLGTEVWLLFTSGFELNLSIEEGVWPRTLAEARAWCLTWADAHDVALP